MRNYSEELDFISIIIPAYNRWHYLEEVVNSIHRNADMPFEIVIHDDHSNDGTRDKILSELKDKVSCVILNNGLQLGLGESINRATKIAGSNYVIMINADCTIEYNCFKDIVNVLKCPFVGCISLMTMTGDNPDITLSSENSKFQLMRGIGSGCALAYRKDTFEEIGGWYSHKVASSNTDVSFMIRLIKAGYFIAALNVRNHNSCIRNLSTELKKCEDSTIARGYYDCSYPRLFGLEKSKYIKMFNIYQTGRTIIDSRTGEEIYGILSRKRYESATDAMQTTYKEEEGETNITWWHNFSQKLIKDDYSIDIEEAKKETKKEAKNFGHHKWVDEIDKYKLRRHL